MSSVARRIIIEEYIDGGFGIFEQGYKGQKESMGLSNEYELIKELINLLEDKIIR